MLVVCSLSSYELLGGVVKVGRLNQVFAVYAFVLGIGIALGYGAPKRRAYA
jgi:hypothetical protein